MSLQNVQRLVITNNKVGYIDLEYNYSEIVLISTKRTKRWYNLTCFYIVVFRIQTRRNLAES